MNSKIPPTLDHLYPNRWIKAGLFDGKQRTLTITDIFQEEFDSDKPEEGKQIKAILSFKETDRQLVLAKINAICIAGMFGRRCPDWIGKRVTFYATDKLMPLPTAKGEDKFCVRVWGSPDLAKDIDVTFAPPKRRPIVMRMVAVRGASTPAPAPAPAVEEDDDAPFSDVDVELGEE